MSRWIALMVLPIILLAMACEGAEGPAGPAGEGVPTPESLVASGAALDVHTHLMSPELAAGFGVPADVPPANADDLISLLDEANVQQAVVLSLAYNNELPDGAAMSAENDYTAAEVAKYPERLIAFCGIHPLRDSAVDEIDRCVDELSMSGLKLHMGGSGIDLRLTEHADAVSAVLDKASERGLPVLMHLADPNGLPIGSDGLFSMAVLIVTHPNLRLAFAHCASGSGFDLNTLSNLLAGFESSPQELSPDNLWLDTSACLKFYKNAPLSTKEEIVWQLRKWGLERVLFGSDYLLVAPQETPAVALETIASFPFTQEELDIILNNDGSAWLEGD